MAKAFKGDMEKILAKLDKIEDKLVDLQKGQLDIKSEMLVVKKDLDDVQKVAQENKNRMGGLEGEVQAMQRKEESRGNVLLTMQLDKMSYFLRFQNLEETDQEDLKDVMANTLAEFTGKDLNFMAWDIDQAYRVNSQYATTHNVPREVHVKFVKRETRDEILRKQREGALTYMGKEVTILKQIPKQVRDLRRKYYFLSSKLYLKGVGFRWLMPEGLMIFWQGSRKKIASVEEAKAYLIEHKSLLEGEGSGVEEGEVVEEQRTGTEGALAAREEEGAVARSLRSKTKK